jgi:hypothetical protein
MGKAFREGFYWPWVVVDAQEVVRTCCICMKHEEVHLIPPMWSLSRWGIDIAGPLPTAPGNYK